MAAERRRVDEAAEKIARYAKQQADSAGLSCSVDIRDMVHVELREEFCGRSRLHDLTILGATPEVLSLERNIVEVCSSTAVGR